MVFGATLLTRRRRWVLQPVAGVTVLDHQPSLVGGVPEGLRQGIGHHTLLSHTAPPCWIVLRTPWNMKRCAWSVSSQTGRDVTDAIITQCVRGCTWHR